MHPIMHMSLLFTSLVLICLDTEKFYEVTGTVDPESEAYYFMTEGKYWFMFYIMSAHLVAIVFHYLAQVLNHYEWKALANLLIVIKVASYLYAITII